MKRGGITVILSWLSLVLLVGCTNTTQPSKSDSRGVMAKRQVLNLMRTQPLTTVDLSKASGYGQLGSSTEGLYRMTTNNQIIPALAKKTHVNAAGTRYTFTLQAAARWNNGQPVTAKDFVFSWRRSINPQTRSPYAYLFDGIKNAHQIATGKLPVDTLGVQAPSTHTLTVTLDHPIAYLADLLAFPLFAPQNQSVAAKYGRQFATTPAKQVYNGPFYIYKTHPSDRDWHLRPNPYYWDRRHVYLKQINVHVYTNLNQALTDFRQHKLDDVRLVGSNSKRFEQLPNFTARPYSRMVFLSYNFQGPMTTASQRLLRQTNARLALSMALNRRQLIDLALGDASLTPNGIVPAGLSRNQKTGTDFAKQQQATSLISYHPAKAKIAWQTALHQVHLTRVTIPIIYSQDPVNQAVVTQLKKQLERTLPGLTIQPIRLSPRQFTASARPGHYELALKQWGADYSDPMSILEIFTSDNHYNAGGWSDKQYDQDIARTKFAPSLTSASRWQTLVAAERRLMTQQAVTPLYQPADSYLVNPRLTGVVQNSVGASSDYKGAYFVQ